MTIFRMFRKKNVLKKSKKTAIIDRVGSLFAVIGFALFIALSPLVINFGPNPTGIYLNKAEAAPICYNTTVSAGNEGECRDNTNTKPSGNRCYTLVDRGNRNSGSSFDYQQTACPVPSSYQPDRSPVCTSQSGQKTDCPDSAENGKCYSASGRQGNSFSTRVCTVADVPSYNPFSTQATADRNNQSNQAPVCYSENGAKTECSDRIANDENNKGKCFKQARNNGPFEEANNCNELKEQAEEVAASEAASNEESCEERMGIGAGWIVCSLIEALSSGMDKMLDQIDSMLNVDALGLNENDELRTVWSYFRAIATFALFAVGLVMVISQAIGGGN